MFPRQLPFAPYFSPIAPAPAPASYPPALPTPNTAGPASGPSTYAGPGAAAMSTPMSAPGSGAGATAYRSILPAATPGSVPPSPGSDDTPARRKLRVVERGREACNECRRHKIRCHPVPDDPGHVHPCARCKRMSLECVFKKHNRGRKRKHPLPDDADAESRPTSLYSPHASASSLAPGLSPGEGRPAPMARSTRSSPSPPPPASPPASPPAHAFTRSVARYPFMAADGGGGASEPGRAYRQHHLNARTMSLRTMLESDESSGDGESDHSAAADDDDAAADARVLYEPPRSAGVGASAGAGTERACAAAHGAADPVSAGLLDAAEAHALFDLFVRHFNANMPVLDPAVHTHDSVRAASALLYAAVLSVTSRFLARLPGARRTLADAAAVHRRIRALARDLLAAAYADAAAGVPVVQAMVVLSLWKEPDDDHNGFIFNRAVILARELQVGRIYSRDELAHMSPRGRREVRMLQRLWLSMFATNSIFFMQFRQPMLISPRDPLIATTEHWLKHADADMRLTDTFVCLNTDLRKRYLHYRELLKPSEAIDMPPPSALSLSVLTRSMNEDWDLQMEAWIRELIDGLINKPRVWTSSLRLNLNLSIVHQTLRLPASEQLQPAPAGSRGPHLSTIPAFHHSLNAATSVLMRMASLDKDQLTFATDTLLHFSLYAATFLWALCALPDAAHFAEPEIEHCRRLILGTAELLDAAAAFPSSSPALHAARLRRLVRDKPAAAPSGYPPPPEPKYEPAGPAPAGASMYGAAHPVAGADAAAAPFAADALFAHAAPATGAATELDLLLGDFPWSGLKTWSEADDGSLFTHFQHAAPLPPAPALALDAGAAHAYPPGSGGDPGALFAAVPPAPLGVGLGDAGLGGSIVGYGGMGDGLGMYGQRMA